MADPTASFVVTARDATSAAIASAEKNLKSLTRTVSSARTLFGAFGLTLSGRAFANWIKGALDAKDLTAEQIAQIQEARKAVNELSTAWDDLGRSIAKAMAPAVSGAAGFISDVRRMLDPTPIEDWQRQVDNAKRAVDDAQHFLDNFQPKRFDPFGVSDDIKQRLQKNLEDAITELDRALRSKSGGVIHIPVELELPEGLTKLDINNLDSALGIRKKPQIEFEPILEPDGLQELIANPPELPIALQLDQMPTKAEIEQALKPLDESLIEAGETLGRGLRDSLVDSLVEGELRFRDFLKRLAAEFLVSQLFSAFSSVLGGKGGFLSGLFGGGKATGGPAEAGMVYRVHKGEAFFTPGESGFIGPVASGSGAAVYVTNHNTYYGTPPADAARHQAETIRRIRADLKNERERGRS